MDPKEDKKSDDSTYDFEILKNILTFQKDSNEVYQSQYVTIMQVFNLYMKECPPIDLE